MGDREGCEMRAQTLAIFLAGIGLSLAIAWMVEGIFGRGVISNYLGPAALVAIFASLLVRFAGNTGARQTSMKAFLRNLVLWAVVVLLLLALFTLWQPGFR
jgi:hypothetical protein